MNVAAPLSETKRRLFTEIVTGVNALHLRDTAPAGSDKDAREEIEEHLGWIMINLDQEDRDEVILENIANAVAAGLRMAERVMQRMTEDQLSALAKDVAE